MSTAQSNILVYKHISVLIKNSLCIIIVICVVSIQFVLCILLITMNMPMSRAHVLHFAIKITSGTVVRKEWFNPCNNCIFPHKWLIINT